MADETEKTIYDLKLHETLILSQATGTRSGSLRVTRVPGGWIYKSYSFNTDLKSGDFSQSESAVFVPFSNEFAPSSGVDYSVSL